MVTEANRVYRQAAVLLLLLLVPLFVSAEKRASRKPQPDAPAAESVEMFAAIEAGDIKVKLTAKNDHEAQIRIKNNTDRPLSVRLPEAFAGVPVLAQFGAGGGVGGAGGRKSSTSPQKQQ